MLTVTTMAKNILQALESDRMFACQMERGSSALTSLEKELMRHKTTLRRAPGSVWEKKPWQFSQQ
jgi:hypothetical protein